MPDVYNGKQEPPTAVRWSKTTELITWISMMSEDMLPTRGLSVLEHTQGTGPLPDIALYIDLRCVCVYEALPATFSQSTQQLWRASKTPMETQQWADTRS